MTIALGIDIGGSGIKGAPVDLERGVLVQPRVKIPTPSPATPDAVAGVVDQIADGFRDDLPPNAAIGVTFPGVVQRGVIRTAANVDKSWIGLPGEEHFTEVLEHPCTILNDADAAGIAELRYGAAKDVPGLVILTTLGTGIGIALIHDGVLIPNAELGHLELDGYDAETRASANAKEREDLSWKAWAARLQAYYTHVENLLWPDLFIVGGGVSRKADSFLPLLSLRTPIVPATLQNSAGIIGAAVLAAERASTSTAHA